MGFFDKLKKAFGAKSETPEEKIEQPEQPAEEKPAEAPESEAAEPAPKEAETPSAPTEETPPEEQKEPVEEPKETPQEKTEKPQPEPVKAEQPAEAAPLKAAPAETKTETPPAAPEKQAMAAAPTPEQPAEVTQEETQPAAENPLAPQNEVEEKYEKGLEKTRKTFGQRLNELLANFRTVDEHFFEELEETLIEADVGFETALQISEELRQEVKLRNAKKPADVQNAIVEKMVQIYEAEGKEEDNSLHYKKDGLSVFLFVGVNGVGKTTSIGKMANQLREQGKKVLLAAADTFRAGAIDQLVVWGERAQVPVVTGKEKSDPASVVFDAMKRAKSEHADVLLVDTAGRLQNKVNLMKELEKIKRVIQREEPDAPQEVLLVIDATTGQNALVQAKQFKETTDVTGIVLTKLDGTAKGGIVLAIRNELHLPVKLVGLGERIDDLEPFEPTEYVYGLFKNLVQIPH
ncbi:MAG: signal recognition particle-docking protein FtsY [Enterococcaceae bacterium]|jgi:fused signal recognition particle receptor|nr:signal recognition particle-docking protein FtsY [Enterococcaceae bacterium]MCI1919629.1 signal recognition particle-docking protein FtsY [Enterococcaceae bacterium]